MQCDQPEHVVLRSAQRSADLASTNGLGDWDNKCCLYVRAAGLAAVKQCDVQDMVLGIPRLLEFVGRNLGAKPHLLGTVAHSFVISLLLAFLTSFRVGS